MATCVLYKDMKCSACGECVGPRDYLTEAEYQMEVYLGNIDPETEEWVD